MAPPRMDVADRRAGFTLVELVVVMVLLSVLSMAAVPSLRGLGDARDAVGATRLRTMLIYAQEWARATSRSTWAVVDTGADSVSFWIEDPANPGAANRVAMTDPLSRRALVLDLGGDGVGIASAAFGLTTEVEFDADGVPSDAGGVALAADGTIVLDGGDTVRVTRNTGLVTID